MKFVLVFVVLGVIAVTARPEDDKYTTKYDNINIDELIQNDRLLRNYVDCLLGTKPCNKDGEELKKVLKDGLRTKCAKCNDTQKEAAKKLAIHLIKNKKPWFDELTPVYDPDHTIVELYREDLKAEGIEL
uniref:Chemosensory protein 1 n=1 Tax=Pyrrhalta aenescens TaxID=281545 RepID=A0A1J0KKN3_9CUCU|nr:chemosensory protein 1 [Pyrrhalta aenescens]